MRMATAPPNKYVINTKPLKTTQNAVTDDTVVFQLSYKFSYIFPENKYGYKQALKGARFAFLIVFAFDKARGKTLQT